MTEEPVQDALSVTERDRRAVSRLEPRLRPADAACDQFGRFYLSDSPRPWSRTTMLGRLIEFGPMGASQSGMAVTAVPPLVMLVDRCFATFSPIRQHVFLTVYVWRRNECREVQIRYARTSRSVFEREKRGALDVVCYALTAENENPLKHVTVCG